MPFPYPVAPLILSHHERWDGKGYPQGLAGEDIPIGARILTIVDYYDAVTTERPYHKALSYESAIGLLKHEAGPRARSEAGAAVHRDAAGARRRARRRRARKWPRREPAPAQPGSTAVGPGAVGRAERVREHRAGAPRDLRALRDRAVDGHQPRRLRHDGADLVEAVEDRAVVGLRALPAAAGRRHAEVPLRGRRRRAEAAERRRCSRATGCRAGWRATAARSSTATRASRFEAAGLSQDDLDQVGDRLPAAVQRHVHRLPGALPRRAEPLHRGSPPAARAHRRAGRRRDPQLDRLRADAGRFAHRSADRRCRTAARCSCTCRASWRAPSG